MEHGSTCAPLTETLLLRLLQALGRGVQQSRVSFHTTTDLQHKPFGGWGRKQKGNNTVSRSLCRGDACPPLGTNSKCSVPWVRSGHKLDTRVPDTVRRFRPQALGLDFTALREAFKCPVEGKSVPRNVCCTSQHTEPGAGAAVSGVQQLSAGCCESGPHNLTLCLHLGVSGISLGGKPWFTLT